MEGRGFDKADLLMNYQKKQVLQPNVSTLMKTIWTMRDRMKLLEKMIEQLQHDLTVERDNSRQSRKG